MRIIKCTKCNAALEVYSDDVTIRCPRCKTLITLKKL